MMKRHWLTTLLVFSLLLNVGVLGAVGYQAWQSGAWPGQRADDKHDHLAKYLNLNAEQRQHWREKEAKFLQEMEADWEAVRIHRERMIRQIFSQQPDLAAIEADRAAISSLQEKQQRHVIAQLMEEQRILDATQREALAGLLIQQKPAGSLEERLHGH
ncbi:MAG: periplasmic heavy metal sensor [Thiobacillus sp.]|nr:periplasmic heavy metal sensor [Thiobacillus sp.]